MRQVHAEPMRPRLYPAQLNMLTRNANLNDANAIAAFVSELSTQHIASSLGKGGLANMLESMNASATKQRIADGWPHVCAFDGDDLVGIVVVKPPTHLYHLFVRTDLHRSGIGTKLLSMADDWSVESSGIRLATVNSSLNAIDFYDRFEFDTLGPINETKGVRCQPMIRQKT